MTTLKDLYDAEKNKPTPAQQFLTEIADLCGVQPHTVKFWLLKVRKPNKAAQKLIAQKYGVDADELLNF